MKKRERSTIRDQQIESVDQFVKEVLEVRLSQLRRRNKNAELLFRGQAADYPLIPKLGRKQVIGQTFKELEALLFQEFLRMSSAFKDFQPGDEWGHPCRNEITFDLVEKFVGISEIAVRIYQCIDAVVSEVVFVLRHFLLEIGKGFRVQLFCVLFLAPVSSLHPNSAWVSHEHFWGGTRPEKRGLL
jgi:hypothetical protein